MIGRVAAGLLIGSLLTGAAPVPADHPRAYLASIVALPLGRDQRISAFVFETWGVDFVAVCHIPSGWRITAGRSANPSGDLKGEGSNGVTWLWDRNPPELRDLVLVRLYDRVQHHDIDSVPATFKGRATVETPDTTTHVRLSYRNVRLRPARRCPSLPG